MVVMRGAVYRWGEMGRIAVEKARGTPPHTHCRLLMEWWTMKAAFTRKAAGRRASMQSQLIDAFQAPGTRLYLDFVWKRAAPAAAFSPRAPAYKVNV